MFDNSPPPELKDEMNNEMMKESVASGQRNATVDVIENLPEQVTCIIMYPKTVESLSLSDSKLGPQFVATFAKQL